MGGCLASPSRALTPSEQEAVEAFPSSRTHWCVAFQSPQRNLKRPYLRYDAQGSAAGGSCRELRLDGEGVASPYTRFYVEPSREHDGLVHIRCCYDNRYWAAEQRRDDDRWVVGTADEVEEDVAKPTCTLFRTTLVPPHSMRLLHVHMEKYVCLPSVSSDTVVTLESAASTYTVHDLSQQFVLPRYVAFKGDNGKYLRASNQERHDYIQFSGRDIGDEAVLNTVHTNADGTIRVRSSYVRKFWRRSPNWIWADSDGGDDDGRGDTLFRAIRLPSGAAGGFVLALQNLGNDYFCKRLTTEGKRSCLNAGTPTVTPDARLQLEEAVVSREIYNLVFDLSGARVYGRSVATMDTASALNGTTSNNTVRLALEHVSTEKRTWGSTVTLKLDCVATTICAGIPVIVAGEGVEVSSEFNGPYGWGSTAEKAATQNVSYEVTVPPKTRVTVACTATRASCDVPFSYTQRDTLVNGTEVTCEMDDGLYTGVNCYDFKYATSEENI